jgi:hypothetical protein
VPTNDGVTLKEYMEALRIADQRALELLAKSNSDRIKHNVLICSLLISVASIIVAIAAVVYSRHGC